MKSLPNDPLAAVGTTLSNLGKILEDFSKASVEDSNYFEQACKAAFIKAYEFSSLAIKTDSQNPFFLVSALRGICEDYIALKFIHEKFDTDSNTVIQLRLDIESYKSSISQWEFFKKNRPDQQLYYQDDFQSKLDKCNVELRSLMNIKGIQCRDSMPSVSQMAKHSDLFELYEYVYHATSSLVHFNPRILMRMGWGVLPDIQFSTQNFEKYYNDFSRFYSLYLLSKFGRWLMKINFLDDNTSTEFQQIDDSLHAVGRWPELVTFEEHNIGGVSRLMCFSSPSQRP